MGNAPRDLSGSRGTTGLGDLGHYSFGEDAGQQGTRPGLGFALPEYGSNLDAGPPSGISFAQPGTEIQGGGQTNASGTI